MTARLSHPFQIRVYYEDTDAGGVVYHASFLKFGERARTEWLRSVGFGNPQLRDEQKILLVVRKIEIDYLTPGRLDDLIDIRTELEELGGSSFNMKQIFSCGDKVLAEMTVVIVAVGTESSRPVRIPPQLRQILEG